MTKAKLQAYHQNDGILPLLLLACFNAQLAPRPDALVSHVW